MRICSIQGNFGNISDKKIVFKEGFTYTVLPNGWGKTTLCAFIRVMFYGLNTAKRDTAGALSDKTQYLPLAGGAMYGRMTVEYQGRNIVIIRATGKGGPMQQFSAMYEDTGEECLFLNGKNCGQTLLGIGEDGFRSSIFIDGGDMQRPSEELRERILAMAQDGDTQGKAADALRAMDRWRLDLDSGKGHGVIPSLTKKLDEYRGLLARLDALDAQILQQKEQVARLEEEEAQLKTAYEKAYRAYSSKMVTEQDRLRALIEESQKMIKALSRGLPEEEIIRTAAEALYGYEGAVQLEREKRQKLAQQEARFEQALTRLREERQADEIARNEESKPKIRWFAMLLALLFATGSAVTILLEIDWGPYTQYIPLVLSGMTVTALIAAFAGSVKKPQAPARDFEEEERRLRLAREQEGEDQRMAASVLQEAHDTLFLHAKAIAPDARTIEQAAGAIRQAQDNLQALRREQAALREFLMQEQRLIPREKALTSREQEAEALRAELKNAQKRLQSARETLAQLTGQKLAGESREQIQQNLKTAQTQLDKAERDYRAVCEAIAATEQEHAAMSARVAPLIARKTQEYMAYLTQGQYTEVRLDHHLAAKCAGEDGNLLDILRLSAGTSDQLYLALRLAISEILTQEGEPVPLILDDPFLTFDDARMAQAMTLLREIGKTRQVIVLACRSAAK